MILLASPLPLVWKRTCPRCGQFIEKTDPVAPFVCWRCGWRAS